jgi:hypothetical protein
MQARYPLLLEAASMTRTPCLVLAILLPIPIASCAGTPVRWESRYDGAAPTLVDSTDCRAQARRHTEMRYPRPVRDLPSGRSTRASVALPADGDRFAAEISFYAQCMRQKGFELVNA